MKATNDDDKNNNNNSDNNNNNNNKAIPPPAASSASAYTELPAPLCGGSDWRSFRSLRLSNGVSLTLVHDGESKTTAIAAAVEAGAASDPRTLSGLAHFCEHMVFLGSEAYPGENEYKQHLAQHGGRSNASTSLHLTTFKCEVLAPHAEKAIDIFSNFFVAPLFTKSGTEREVNAVDSENSKNLTADVRRRLQILKALADPEHYFSKFTTGNHHTLPTSSVDDLDRIRSALLAFHRKHYRPDKLTVVVAGPQDLETLQEWTVPRFGAMRARDESSSSSPTELERLIEAAAADAPAYGYEDPAPAFDSPFRPELQGGQWPVLLTIQPVRSMRKLSLMFPVESTRKNPDRSPTSILSHLLGHEGPQSPFALLQNRGLISSLSAGSRFSEPTFNLFQVDMALTEEGEDRWKEVVDVILQYARFLARTAQTALQDENNSATNLSELHRIWRENTQLSQIFFDQTSPGSVYDLCPSLCGSIIAHGTEHCLSAGYMLQESEKTLPLADVAKFAAQLTADNCIIERCSPDAWKEAEASESLAQRRYTEQWYGVDYFVSTIDPADVARWNDNPFLDARAFLDLPRSNRYIPRSLELCPDLPPEARAGPRIEKPMDPPRLVINDTISRGRLWHRLDDRYALPKANISLLLANAAVEYEKILDKEWSYSAPRRIRSSILSSMFQQALAQDTYDASLAGLSWNVGLTGGGLRFSFGGFSDRLGDLATLVVDEFLSNAFLQHSHFVSAQDKVVRGLRTFFESRRADAHANYYRDLLLDSSSEGVAAALEAAQTVTLDDIKQHHQTLLHNPEIYLDCLVCGNLGEQEARTFFTQATDRLLEARNHAPLVHPNMWFPGTTERRLTAGNDVELHFTSENPHEENGALVATFQSPTPGFRGKELCPAASLKSTACMRVLAHILKEPVYDELRTKQALGYIVSSYYDVSTSLRPPQLWELGPQAIPVDSITIAILSRKVAPPELQNRMDEFLAQYRDVLVAMPESEIDSHARALSAKLLKPIQKLGAETSSHVFRIHRYASEVLLRRPGSTGADLPWDNAKVLAHEMTSVTRDDLLETWDKLFLPDNRARVVSMVYGSTFPLQQQQQSSLLTKGRTTTMVVNQVNDILALRRNLAVYDEKVTPRRAPVLSLRGLVVSHPSVVAAASVVGVGIIGWTLLGQRKRVL